MKLYSINPYTQNNQTLKKYCADLDKQITAVQNYIDFNMPNYIGLNNTNPAFYSQESLVTLGILSTNQLIIYPEKMHAGQIVHQNWTTNLVTVANEPEGVSPEGLPNGWALVKHSNGYEKFSLAAAGDFYVLIGVECPNSSTFVTHWRFMENAASTFGTNYSFSLLPMNARFFYYNTASSSTNKTIFRPDSWTHIVIPNWFKSGDEMQLQLITKQPLLWDATYALGHEIFFNNEEIFCDVTHETKNQVFEKRSLSSYNMNTNIDIRNSNFYIYFY